jgi:hypothetical protein
MSDELDALGYLQGIYRGKIIPDGQRMKAAIAALPFESPKLSVVTSVAIGFASRLEAAAERQGRSMVIDATPKPQAIDG